MLQRVANALNISIRTVSSISQSCISGEPLRSPIKTKTRAKPVTDIDDFDQSAIRNTIYDMIKNKQYVTQKTLLQVLKEKDIFHGSISSLRVILHKIGFRYKKDDPRRGLMELPNIALARIRFLREYVRNLKSENSRQCVFLDETWVFENGTTCRSWQDDNVKSVRKTKPEGRRYIVLNAGSSEGFIPGASLIFSSNTQDPDYHGEMNKENFLKWFKDQLLTKLEEPSLIIMDNASYHSSLLEKQPHSGWNKPEIQKWLQERNLEFPSDAFKLDLLDIVSRNRPEKVYAADQMALEHGHIVLRLAPYHCIFNPIEKIWGIAKQYYNKAIGEDGWGREKCLQTWQEAIHAVTPQMWENTVEDTNRIIMEWWHREVGFDREDVAPLIINLEDISDESGSDFEDEV